MCTVTRNVLSTCSLRYSYEIIAVMTEISVLIMGIPHV